MAEGGRVADGAEKGEEKESTMMAVHRVRPRATMIRRRTKALKILQTKAAYIKYEFCKESHLLVCKYNRMLSPLHDKRGAIIAGEYEPTDAERDWESEDEEVTCLTPEMKDLHANKKRKIETTGEETGIPGFWLKVFKNVKLLSTMIKEHDEPILKHLTNIKTKMLESDPMGVVCNCLFKRSDITSARTYREFIMLKITPEQTVFSSAGVKPV